MLSQTSAVIRFFSFITLVTFFPSCVTVWNFLPDRVMVASAEEAPDAKTAANTRTGQSMSKALPRILNEELKTAVGGPGRLGLREDPPEQTARRIRVAQAALSLPTAEVLLASIPRPGAQNTGTTNKEDKPKPAKLAQLGGGVRDVRGPAGPQQAVDDLAAADSQKSNGDYSGALTAYFDVMDQYSGTNEALWADQGMWDILEAVADVTISRNQLATFEYSLRTWQPQTISGIYAAVTYNANRALAEHKAGNQQIANNYASLARVDAWNLLASYPDHYLSMSAADYYLDVVRVLGLETQRTAMDELAKATYELESCPAKLGALFALGKHYSSNDIHDNMKANLAWQFTVAETNKEYVEPLFFYDDVPYWVKGYMCEYFGRANAGLGNYADAKGWYDRGVNLSTRIGPTHYFLAFMSCLIDVQMNPMNLDVPVQSIQDYLNTYPESNLTGRALIELGALYMLASDYQGAADFFREVIQREPESKMGLLAQHELSYIMEHLYESVDYAKAQQVEQMGDVKLAQVCGPNALKKMLDGLEINSSVDELAELAKTDETGTTMLGLVEAARAKGLELIGVRANSAAELNLPAIAYVNQSHFMLVTDVLPDAVMVYDGSKGERALTSAEFTRIWNGEALVNVNSDSAPMTIAALKQSKGGAGDPQPPDDNYTAKQFYVGSVGGAGTSAVDPMFIAAKAGSNVSTSVASPGVNFEIHGFETALDMREVDMSMPCRGPLEMVMGRAYINEKGYPRTFNNGRMGEGWCSFLSICLQIGPLSNFVDKSSYPYNITLQDSTGTPRLYTYAGQEFLGHYVYKRSSTGQTDEKATVILYRHTGVAADRTSLVVFPDGKVYNFSTAGSNPSGAVVNLLSIRDADASNYINFTYDGSNRLTKVQSPQGDTRHIGLSYDASSRLTKVELKETSTVLQTVNYAYNSSSLLTKVTDNEGKSTQYEYQTQGGGSRVITKITDKASVVTNLTWYFADDAGGSWGAYKIELTDAAGLKTVYDRSISSSIDTVTPKDGVANIAKVILTPLAGDSSRNRYYDSYKDASSYNRFEYEYNGTSDLTKNLRPGGITEKNFAYNSAGRISTVINNAGSGIDFDYGSNSNSPTKITDPLGLTLNLYYDTNNFLTKMSPPHLGSNGIVMSRDNMGQITATTNPDNNTYIISYDANGIATKIADPDNNESTYEYDRYGNVTKVTDVQGKSTYLYFAAPGCTGCGTGGQLTKVKDSLNYETVFAYDTAGNKTKTTDSNGVITDYFYDEKNKLTKTECPSGSGVFSTTEYDKLGRATKLVDLAGKWKTNSYDFQGQLTSQADAVGTYAEFSYFSNGKLSMLRDGAGRSTSFEYDQDLQLTKLTRPNGEVLRYLYDAGGHPTKIGGGATASIDPSESFYNATTGLLTRIRYNSSAGSNDLHYQYNNEGKITKILDWLDGTNGIRYTYDSQSRLSTVTDYDNSVLRYNYDPSGNIITMEDYHGTSLLYTYTNRGQISTLTAPGSKTWDYDYNGLGDVTQCALPNGMVVHYAYDNVNLLTAIEYKDGASVLDGFSYAYDKQGLTTRQTNEDNSRWDYWYDLRGRLTKAERIDTGGGLVKRWTYTYSAANAISTKQVYDGASTNTYVYSYDTNGALTAQTIGASTTAFSYDSLGRLTAKANGALSAAYHWNYGDKLTKVTSNFPGEGTVEYEFGGDGKLRERYAGGVLTRYNPDSGGRILNEEDSSGVLIRTYIESVGEIVGSTPVSGSYYYYCLDLNSSVRRVRAQDKSSAALYDYTPNGDVLSHAGTDFNRQYQFSQWDPCTSTLYSAYGHYAPDFGLNFNANTVNTVPSGTISGLQSSDSGAATPPPRAKNANNPQVKPHEWIGTDKGGFSVDKFGWTAKDSDKLRRGVNIEYNPPAGSQCDHISLLQTKKHVPIEPQIGPALPRGGFITWFVPDIYAQRTEPDRDRDTSSFFLEESSGVMQDFPQPNQNFKYGGSKLFETCALCTLGKDEMTLYGCVDWSFSWPGGAQEIEHLEWISVEGKIGKHIGKQAGSPSHVFNYVMFGIPYPTPALKGLLENY